MVSLFVDNFKSRIFISELLRLKYRSEMHINSSKFPRVTEIDLYRKLQFSILFSKKRCLKIELFETNMFSFFQEIFNVLKGKTFSENILKINLAFILLFVFVKAKPAKQDNYLLKV